MPSVITALTSPARLGRIGITIFLGWSVGFIIYHAASHRLIVSEDIVIGRDFMAFYIGGRIVLEGEGRRLYDPPLQQQTQDAIVAPENLKGLSYFINPAPVAVAYSFLARLPYRLAFYLHTLLMLGCFLAGTWALLARSNLPLHSLIVGLLAVGWLPLMHTITGGQNAALTVSLLCGAFLATVACRPVLAGVALGLLLFKPQFAIPLLGLLMLRRQWLTVAVAAICGFVHYVVGALCCGWDWPARMRHFLTTYYRQAEDATNSDTHMSLMEVLDFSIIQPLGGPHGIGRGIQTAGYVLVGLAVLYLIWTWRDADPARSDYGLYWALAVSATLIISPHTQYYDGAILVLPIILIVGYLHRTGCVIGSVVRWALVLLYLGYLPLSYVPQWFPSVRFQPVFLVPVCVCIWAAILISRKRCRTTGSTAGVG